MPTPEIFDFDAAQLEGYDAARAADALVRHPAVYVNHLQLARHLEEAAGQVEAGQVEAGQVEAGPTDAGRAEAGDTYDAGFAAALRAVVARLRSADYLSDGPLLYEAAFTHGRFKAR